MYSWKSRQVRIVVNLFDFLKKTKMTTNGGKVFFPHGSDMQEYSAAWKKQSQVSCCLNKTEHWHAMCEIIDYSINLRSNSTTFRFAARYLLLKSNGILKIVLRIKQPSWGAMMRLHLPLVATPLPYTIPPQTSGIRWKPLTQTTARE